MDDFVVVTPEGVCQLGDISQGGISFKCLYLQTLPETYQIDILNTSGTHLENLSIEKVWESREKKVNITDIFAQRVGARFKELSLEQESKLCQLFDCIHV
ncbi:MAG: PilZ domain-containing protein [Desulfofustis sp.]|nr:PilZ domain-containing protein [Desulfofustis sp.]